MIKKCSTKEILGQIAGIVGVNCSLTDFSLDDQDGLEEGVLEDGTLFSILGGEGNAYSGVEAQTATSSDGAQTYVITKAKEGYIVDFPPFENVCKKLNVVKEYFNSGIYIVVKNDNGYRIYGIEKDEELIPFSISNFQKIMPNGRFGSGTTLPINQLSFVIEDDVDLSIAYFDVDDCPENQLSKIVKLSTTSLGFYVGDNLDYSKNEHVTIPTAATITGCFENQNGVIAATVATGDIAITVIPTAGDVVSQVKPIEGIWSYNSIIF